MFGRPGNPDLFFLPELSTLAEPKNYQQLKDTGG
jgi:hypothetical protein